MWKWNKRRILLAVIGAIAAVALLSALVSFLNSGATAHPAAMGPLSSFFVPIASLFVILAVIWLLLSQTRSDDGGSGPPAPGTCAVCGRDVLSDWRLCPYCGALFDEPPPMEPVHGGLHVID